MRVLVTGGAGFLGSNAIDALVVRGDVSVALDDLSTGHRANLAPDVPPTHVGAETNGPAAETWERTMRARRGRRTERDDA